MTSEHRAPSPYGHITDSCYICVPFQRLQGDLLELVLTHRINPEIGLDGDILYNTAQDDFIQVAETLTAAGLSCTLHAPFFDLAPGSLDPRIRQATREKLERAFDLIPLFRPAAIVCHMYYVDNMHGYRQDEWFRHSLATWRGLLERAERHQTPMMLENTYEQSPAQLQRMLAALDSPMARFCLDTGHVLAFAENTWQDWLPALEPWLGQLHLHDNHGGRDEHLPIGAGRFDFAGLFAFLRQRNLDPLVTLEPHSEENLWKSLEGLDRINNFPFRERL